MGKIIIKLSDDPNVGLTKLQRNFFTSKIRDFRECGVDRQKLIALLYASNAHEKAISFIEKIWPEETNDNDR